MLRRLVTPLRDCIDGAIDADGVRIIGKSWNDADMSVEEIVRRSGLPQIAADPVYGEFVPRIGLHEAGVNTWLTPMAGMASFPMPPLPFTGAAAGFASIAVLSNQPAEADADSRRFWMELQFDLGREELIGGICFSGMPGLPALTDKSGRSSSNAALPREVRLSWDPAVASEQKDVKDGGQSFLDAEDMITRQEMVSHGGVHVIRIPPFQGNHLRVRLADFPRIIVRIDTDGTRTDVDERWGILIPFMTLFRHTERTRFKPHVSGGILQTAVREPGPAESWTPGHTETSLGDVTNEWSSAAESVIRRGTEYYTLSSSPLTGASRTFSPADGSAEVTEYFRSPRIKEGESVRLWVEQSEAFERCVAGLTLDVINFRVVVRGDKATREGEQITSEYGPKWYRIQIFEVDPPENVAHTRLDLSSRFAHCLYDERVGRDIDEETQLVVCRFARPSICRTFAVVLTAVATDDDKPAPIMLRKIGIVQSTTVTLPSRPAVNQRLRGVHFRFIGPQLAGDYSTAGRAGAALTVERVTAGERKEIVYQADHLLDLLHSGMGRLFANHRYEETVVEKTTSDAASTSWRRAETGSGVSWDTALPGGPTGGAGFRQFGNQEVRTRLRHVSGLPETARTAVNAHLDALDVPDEAGVLGKDAQGVLWSGWSRLVGQDTTYTTAIATALQLGGLVNVNVPPGYATLGSSLKALFDALAAGNTVNAKSAMDQIFSPACRDVFLANGLSAGLSGGIGFIVGVNGSATLSWPLPLATQTTVYGSSGTIALQGNEARYSYGQHLHRSGERTVTTRRVNNTEKARRTGYEVQWLGDRVDIVSGMVPVRAELPALAGPMYHTSDDAVRVRVCGGRPGPEIAVDVWFELDEEPVRDDR